MVRVHGPDLFDERWPRNATSKPPVFRRSGLRMSHPWLMMKSVSRCLLVAFSPVQMGRIA